MISMKKSMALAWGSPKSSILPNLVSKHRWETMDGAAWPTQISGLIRLRT